MNVGCLSTKVAATPSFEVPEELLSFQLPAMLDLLSSG